MPYVSRPWLYHNDNIDSGFFVGIIMLIFCGVGILLLVTKKIEG